MADYFRVAAVLYDGRRVIFSKRGKVHLMRRSLAEFGLGAKSRDPGVYSHDLAYYANRSLFLESLAPFVAVREFVVEPESAPLGPRDFILGGLPASEAEAIYDDRQAPPTR